MILDITDCKVINLAETKTILKIYNMQIEPRTFVTIIGKNGQGKTALMKAICEYGPFKIIGNSYINNVKRFVYLDTEPLAGIEHWITADEIFRLFCRVHKHELEKIYSSINFNGIQNEIMNAVKERRQIADFSSGQRQLIFMIAAIHSNANFWAIDEGLSALDPFQLDEALRLLKEDIIPAITETKGVLFTTTHSLSIINKLGTIFNLPNWQHRIYICNEHTLKEHELVSFPISEHRFKSLYGDAER